MAYLKKRLDEAGRDSMRINLSVQPKKVSPEPICDFCWNPKPVVIYAASQLTTGEIVDCWRWAACGVCEHLIDGEQWQQVELRVENRLMHLYEAANMPVPKDLIYYAVKGALDQFHRYAIRI